MKKIFSILLIVFMILGCSACGKKDLSKGEVDKVKYEETSEVTNYVKIETTKNKVILIELYPDVAPITVGNFQKLVSEKFYDGIIFHRVINNFMIQTGDPEGTGMGGSEENIKGEFASNDKGTELKGNVDLSVEYDGNVKCDTIEVYSNGTVYLADCKVDGNSVEYTYGTKQVATVIMRATTTAAIYSPCATYCPADTYNSLQCAYNVSTPFPWFIFIQFP